MEKRRRTSYLPEETDEDVSLRVGEFREDEGDEPGVRVCTCIACVNAEREGEREREESKGRARSGWMHSGYFWIDPDIRRPCFLGPCFKLFRIINELNRIRACRLPHCPRSRRGRKLLSLQKFTTPGYLALPVPATKSKGRRKKKEKEHPRYAHNKPIYSATLELNNTK